MCHKSLVIEASFGNRINTISVFILHKQASFEVSIDGTLIHSKIKTMSFPDFDEVADIVSSVDSGEAVRQVSKTEMDGCNIM